MRLLCASLLAGFVLCGALQGLYWGRTQLDAGAAPVSYTHLTLPTNSRV